MTLIREALEREAANYYSMNMENDSPMDTDKLRQKIGQMLLVGFPSGEEGMEHLRAAVSEFSAGNFILFSRNIGDPEEIFALTNEVRRVAVEGNARAPLIAIDQEGGVVARIRRGVTPIPGAMAQASALRRGGRRADDVRKLGALCGAELSALGIDWDLAPVADVNVNPANPVIGVRSYGEDPALVATLAAAFASGLASSGVLATAKHFPGHGDTTVDSHLGLPLITHDRARLEAVELVPFKRLIAEGVGAVMTAHVRFPAIESESLPATLSSKVLQGLLREALGFRGIIVSDCLEMKAIADNYPEAAVQAVKAGADILDVSHTFETQRAAARAIEAAVLSGEIPEARIDESVSRIAAAKARVAPAPVSWEEARSRIARAESLAFSEAFYRDSFELLAPGRGLPQGKDAFYVDVLPSASSFAEAGGGGGGAAAGPEGSVVSALAGMRARGAEAPAAIAVSVDPNPADVARALAAAKGVSGGIAVGLHQAASHPGQVELVRALASFARAEARDFAIVSMRSPYDISLFSEQVAGGAAFFCAYEYTPPAAAALAEMLAGRA
jgi:beta-N-acetylhexosaminidase